MYLYVYLIKTSIFLTILLNLIYYWMLHALQKTILVNLSVYENTKLGIHELVYKFISFLLCVDRLSTIPYINILYKALSAISRFYIYIYTPYLFVNSSSVWILLEIKNAFQQYRLNSYNFQQISIFNSWFHTIIIHALQRKIMRHSQY